MKVYRCCEHCFKKINKKSINAAQIWIYLCTHAVEEDGFVFLKKRHSHQKLIKILEVNKFVLTHEIREAIILRVNGIKKKSKLTVICNDAKHLL